MNFIIKRGKHYSNNFLYKFINLINFRKKINCYVNFDDSALYNDETIDKFDVNKLIGFSMGYHHTNSYRFGWNSLNGRINIYAYAYINGVRVIKDMCIIDTNKDYKLTIKQIGYKVIFMVFNDGRIISRVPLDIPKIKMIGYNLWPYFGGNKLAPHDIKIHIRKQFF